MQSTNPKPKVIAVASFGGHLVQLLRILTPISHKYDISYVSTSDKAQTALGGARLVCVDDFSRTTPWVLLRSVRKFRQIFRQEMPSAVISTGAAPGLAAIIAARSLGIPTMWVDSIANADHLSVSGRMAARFATRTLTQWPHLASGKVEYCGNVLS